MPDQAERAALIIRALSEALGDALHQIGMMQGLCDDNDGTIEAATDAGEAAMELAGVYLADHGRDSPA